MIAIKRSWSILLVKCVGRGAVRRGSRSSSAGGRGRARGRRSGARAEGGKAARRWRSCRFTRRATRSPRTHLIRSALSAAWRDRAAERCRCGPVAACAVVTYAVEPGGGNVADREPRPPSPRFRLSDVACGLLLLWWSHADPDYHTGCGKYSTIVCERRAVCGAHVSARTSKK